MKKPIQTKNLHRFLQTEKRHSTVKSMRLKTYIKLMKDMVRACDVCGILHWENCFRNCEHQELIFRNPNVKF